jgi:hypothetical protein
MSECYRAGVGRLDFVGLLFFVLFGVFCFLVWVVGTQGPMYPASALKCIGPGPLGDASGNFSLVVASVNVGFVTVACVMWMPLC